MRWNNATPPSLGDTRIVKRFLLFPIRLGDESRWLEVAIIKQTFVAHDLFPRSQPGYWKDTSWTEPTKTA